MINCMRNIILRLSIGEINQKMSKKPRVEFIQNAEPSFIREFKERAGIPAADTIESKRKQLDKDDDGDDENRPEEEQPQLVYDPCSNVDELEARAFIKQWQYEHKLGYIPPIEDENMKKEKLDVPNRIIYRSAEERNSTPGNNATNGGGGVQSNIEGLRRDHRNNDKKNKNTNSHDNSRSHNKKPDRDRSPLDSKRKGTKCSLLSFDLEAEEEDEG
ncbi:unnamed protein product [Trichobilharzia szidati]|nr:unnamed protein product [Trichobilharzia szidati]